MVPLLRLSLYPGKTKAVGNMRNDLPVDYVYGKPSLRRGEKEWDAKACLQGEDGT